MERPPRSIEYICLACGTQGLAILEVTRPEKGNLRSGRSLRCPKCQSDAFLIEREAASDVLVGAPSGLS